MFAVSPNLVCEGNNAKSQTSLRLPALGFSFAVGYSRFLGRQIEHLKSVLHSVAPAPLPELLLCLCGTKHSTWGTA